MHKRSWSRRLRSRFAAIACATLLPAASPTLLRAQPTPDASIRAVMSRPEFAHATFGMEFYDIAARKTVWSMNGEHLFVPGSTTKLLTMGTALETLGPDHRFRTRVYRTGPIRDGVLNGDLVLVAVVQRCSRGRGRAAPRSERTTRSHQQTAPP